MQKVNFSLPLSLLLYWVLTLVACNMNTPVKVDGVEVASALRRAADDLGFDYTGHLAKALQGDKAALEKLLQFNPASDSLQLAHGAVLLSILKRRGDAEFAGVVATQSPETKTAIWAAMEGGTTQTLNAEAPATRNALMPPASVDEYRGLYVFDEKTSIFRDCANPEKRFIVVDETGGTMEKNYRRLLRYPYPGQPVFAEIKGYTAGYYGDLSLPANFAGFFVVKEILDIEPKNYRNTCIQYDYWALGTEPFWYAQISKGEGIIEYRGMEDERTKVFAYLPPSLEEDSSLVYAAINQETGDNVRITVKEEPCSDGMSEIQYLFSVDLTMNGTTLKGCGIKFGTLSDEDRE